MLKNYDVAIVRIVGNELPPRHKPGSNLEQLQFILESEPSHPRVKKLWILNRLVDSEQERALIALLEKYQAAYISLPFDIAEYREFLKRGDYLSCCRFYKRRHYRTLAKAGFIIEINRARNKAMEAGAPYADWVIPLDGGCCLDAKGMALLLEKLQRPERDAYALPTYRLVNNANYADFRPEDYPMHESMLVLKHTVHMPFDETIPYGRGEKLKTIFRLFPRSARRRTAYAYLIDDLNYQAGYVIRLSSGNALAEGKYRKRVKLRMEGLSRLVDAVDRLALVKHNT